MTQTSEAIPLETATAPSMRAELVDTVRTVAIGLAAASIAIVPIPADPGADAVSGVGSAGSVEGAAPTPPAKPAPSVSASPHDLSGRWVGVEGMYLDIAPAGPGAYTLAMQYDLDHKGNYTGHADGDGIAFERDGKRLTLAPSDGAATGLKYLAGKKDCLTVAPGEGYCRD